MIDQTAHLTTLTASADICHILLCRIPSSYQRKAGRGGRVRALTLTTHFYLDG